MRNILQIVLLIHILLGCNPNKQTYNSYESETLKIEQINENIFVHISYLETKNYGKYPCNGMVYIKDNEAIIFDTPTNNKASAELINWIGNKAIKAVVVTHFHDDCLGGLEEFHSKNIRSFSTIRTIELAKNNNKNVLPQTGFKDKLKLKIGNEVVYANYYGEGHTKDNIVGVIPSEKTLFGGCLIKELNSSKGNLVDASTENWARTVERIKSEFPEIINVVPGHGKIGGIELLDYTIKLFTIN